MNQAGSRSGTETATREDRALDLWRQALAAGDDGKPARAVRLCDRALRILGASLSAGVRAQVLITSACYRSELGEVGPAMALLDAALALDPGHEPAVLTARGLVLGRSGHPDAIVALNAAIDVLTGVTTDTAQVGAGPSDLASALLNRGVLLMMQGRLADAERDTRAAEHPAAQAGRHGVVLMARHNLGYIRYLKGDLPGALQSMSQASEMDPQATLGVPQLDRARVLLSAGLLTEAREFADAALAVFRINRAKPDLAEAWLVRAEIDLLSGEPHSARECARRAAELYARRGNVPAMLTARLSGLRASTHLRSRTTSGPAVRDRARGRARSPGSAAGDARAASDLAAELTGAGLLEQATVAHLLGAEASLDAGRPDSAAEQIAAIDVGRTAPSLAVRLHTRLVNGRIMLARDQRAKGLAEIRRGLDDLADFQARFGSQDLQAGAAIHGRELARLGLRTAMATGSPAAILQWLERARAATSWLPAVRPSADAVLAEALGALRIADEQARAAVLAGRRDAAAEQRVDELRRRVRARSWVAGGTGARTRPLSLAAVRRALAESDPEISIVAPFIGAGRFHALTITAGSARYLPLGSDFGLVQLLRRLTGDLNMLADHRIPTQLRKVAAGSLRAGLAQVAAAIVEPVQGFVGAGPVIVAASGAAATVPWALLPGMSGRAVSVSPSVTAAVRQLRRARSDHLRGVLAVAGPDVPHAEKEVFEVAGTHSNATVLTGQRATGRAVLESIPAGGLLHIAAHGIHVRENPLFSGVLLADGLLYGYDVAPNRTLPGQVVLSSCDVGQTDERPGGEPLGLVAALLRSGVPTVVAGTSRISDEVASLVMADYHHRLVQNQPPAVALAGAIADVSSTHEDPAPFTCFGAGL